MDVRFNLNKLLKEEPILTQWRIKVLEEKEPNMVHEEAKEENRIILDLKEREVESKPP